MKVLSNKRKGDIQAFIIDFWIKLLQISSYLVQ